MVESSSERWWGSIDLRFVEGDFSEEAGACGCRRNGELYQFVIREGKEAWMEVEHW